MEPDGRGSDGALAVERRLNGDLLATLAHEMNNRLATLQESGGLLCDLLESLRGPKGETLQGCRQTAAGLEPQLARLGRLVLHLGRYAEGLRAAGPTEAAAALEDLLALTERYARQRQVQVRVDVASGLPRILTAPAAFTVLAHYLLARTVDSLPPAATLRVGLARAEGGVLFRLASPAPIGGLPEVDETARGFAAAAGGEFRAGTAGTEITVYFPASA